MRRNLFAIASTDFDCCDEMDLLRLRWCVCEPALRSPTVTWISREVMFKAPKLLMMGLLLTAAFGCGGSGPEDERIRMTLVNSEPLQRTSRFHTRVSQLR